MRYLSSQNIQAMSENIKISSHPSKSQVSKFSDDLKYKTAIFQTLSQLLYKHLIIIKVVMLINTSYCFYQGEIRLLCN